MNYRDKLRDPRWQKKRLEILERDNFSCLHCGDNKTELHIHHLKYHNNPWDVHNDDLQTVCKHCHVGIEFLKKETKDLPPSELRCFVIKEVIDDTFFKLAYIKKFCILHLTFCSGDYSISYITNNQLENILNKITVKA